jgi:glutamate dehydrogenase/leucine dehydrogenase
MADVGGATGSARESAGRDADRVRAAGADAYASTVTTPDIGHSDLDRSDLDREFEHELMQVFADAGSGLVGVVAIHSTALGPAMGGLRLWAYPSVSAGATDALRLARAMSLKNASAGLDLGGGKAVLIDDGRWRDPVVRRARMSAFAEVVERLGGRYITAEDVGTTPQDMEQIGEVTRWVAGKRRDHGGTGDPAPSTARTVFGAIAAGAHVRLGAQDLAGVRVGVQGVGHVGSRLVALLAGAGAEVVLADVDSQRAQRVAADHGARAAPLAGFLRSDVDVLAPCALGEVIATSDVASLRCRVIAGAANNPLADLAAASELATAGILYVPDFLANCGGIIQVGAEVLGFDDAETDRRIEAAIARTAELLAEAQASGRLPQEVAIARAQARIRGARSYGT